MKNRITAKVSIFVLIFSFTNLLNISVSERAFAATAGSGNCVQTVNNASGVAVYEAAGYCYVAFKDVATRVWTPPSGITNIDLLVVAGGGGGGSRHAGGGGGGGLINVQNLTINNSDLTIVVGGGGNGGAAASSGGNNATNGQNSEVSGGGITTRTAIGGGAGSYSAENSLSGGGSGGGGGGSSVSNAGSGTVGQGNNGSIGKSNNTNYWIGGGGGGAGSVGTAATFPPSSLKAGSGGAGAIVNWISTNARSSLAVGVLNSSSVYFAGGGGGGTDRADAAGGDGGIGGGGRGSTHSAVTTSVTNGTANTGGGGGASGVNVGGSYVGGTGGSGVVVIRYIIPVSTFAASNYTAGSTTWTNSISGATAGTAATGGMAKTSSGPTGVIFAGKESSNSDQISSSIGSTTSLDTVTVEMWLKLKDSGSVDYASGSMLFSWNTSPNNYNIYHYGNQVGFNTFDSQLYGIDSTSYNNAWTHFVFVMTDAGPWSSQKVYVNGSLQASTCRVTAGNCSDAQTRTFASNGNFLLMDHPNTSNTWNAKTDVGLIRIYNQEISAASVQSLYNLTSADYATVPDTTPPTFTSSSSFSAAENIATSATAATIRVSESATVTISSGADAARFNISRSDTDTAIIKFNVSPDFEAPSDIGGNNVYDLTLTATDTAGNAGTQSITITVTNVVDTSAFSLFQLAGGATVAAYRTAIVLSATVNVASKITFRMNGKILPGCKNRTADVSGSDFTATCSWRPSNRGTVTLTAAAVPTGAGISSATSAPINIRVGNRTTAR